MKWFSRYTDQDDSEHVVGGFGTEAEATAAGDEAEANGCTIIDRAYQEADNHGRTWQVVAVAVATRPDGVYEIYSDGSEKLLA